MTILRLGVVGKLANAVRCRAVSLGMEIQHIMQSDHPIPPMSHALGAASVLRPSLFLSLVMVSLLLLLLLALTLKPFLDEFAVLVEIEET